MNSATVNIDSKNQVNDLNRGPQTGYMEVVNSDSTNQLIADCKNGVNSAYEKIYSLYSKAMFNISLRITNNREESEDVLQESFLSAFKNIQQFEGRASFGSWLKRIVVNKSIDAVKKRKVKFISFEDEQRDLVLEEETDESEMEYSVEAVNQAVQLLPDGFRTVITLYLFEDYSHKDIGELLGISENTSKTQYLRAKKKLITLLNKK